MAKKLFQIQVKFYSSKLIHRRECSPYKKCTTKNPGKSWELFQKMKPLLPKNPIYYVTPITLLGPSVF